MLDLLKSTRVKAVIFAVVIAIIQKQFPQFMPSDDTMNYLYGLLIAFIGGDSIRPVDPSKKGLFDTVGKAVNDGMRTWVNGNR